MNVDEALEIIADRYGITVFQVRDYGDYFALANAPEFLDFIEETEGADRPLAARDFVDALIKAGNDREEI